MILRKPDSTCREPVDDLVSTFDKWYTKRRRFIFTAVPCHTQYGATGNVQPMYALRLKTQLARPMHVPKCVYALNRTAQRAK